MTKKNTDICSYLESEQDFKEGLLLFITYSKKRQLIKYFQRKGEKAKSKLIYELTKLVHAALKQTISETKGITSKPTIQQQKPTIQHPAQLVIKNQTTQNYKLMRTFFEKMKQASTNEERALFRAKVLQFEDKNTELWSIYDDETKLDAFIEALEPKKPTEKEISAARVYLTRAPEQLEKYTGKKKEEYIAKIKKRVDLLKLTGVSFHEETRVFLHEIGLN